MLSSPVVVLFRFAALQMWHKKIWPEQWSRCLALLPILCAATVPLGASPVAYTMQFTLIDGSLAPVSGSFDYDSSASLDERFSDFIIDWDGVDYNMTDGANDPTVYGTPIASCTPSNDSAGVFYALLNPSDCPGPSAPDGQTEWEGSPVGETGGDFEFVFGTYSDALGFEVVEPTSGEVPTAIGSWTVTEVASAPEPGSMALILVGALPLLGLLPRGRLASSVRVRLLKVGSAIASAGLGGTAR